MLCAGIGERGDIFDPSVPRLKQPGSRAPGWQLTLDVDLTAVMTGTRCERECWSEWWGGGAPDKCGRETR